MKRYLLPLLLTSLSLGSASVLAQDTNATPVEVNAPVSVDALKLQLKPLTQPELEAAAKAWQKKLQEVTTEITTAEITALDATGDAKSTALAAAAKAREAQTRTADRFKVVLDA